MLWSVFEILLALISSIFYSMKDLLRKLAPKLFVKDITGQAVLITGAGSGLGRLFAIKMAKLGAKVVLVDINEDGNLETAKMVKNGGGTGIAYTVNLSDRDALYETAKKIKTDVGSISILINNAGIVSGTSLLETSDDKIKRTFDVNVLAHFYLIKAFLPDMIANKNGHIVNIASLAGYAGTKKLVDYCSSKFAAVGLDEALRAELRAEGHSEYIQQTLVCPYFIKTGMFSGVYCKIIPMLDPEYVVDKAVKGIITNAELVVVPSWCKSLLAIKGVLPIEGMLRLSDAFGFSSAMDSFEGRRT